jgi:hypothetical protein
MEGIWKDAQQEDEKYSSRALISVCVFPPSIALTLSIYPSHYISLLIPPANNHLCIKKYFTTDWVDIFMPMMLFLDYACVCE